MKLIDHQLKHTLHDIHLHCDDIIKENLIISIVHSIYDGEPYTKDSEDIPSSVAQGLANVFRRYPLHLKSLQDAQKNMSYIL